MKTKIQLFIGITLLFFMFNLESSAQILQTKSEIIKTYGTPFSAGITEDGEHYLFYKIPVTTANSGTYLQRRVMYFNGENADDTCYKWKIIEPSSETRFNISSFKENLVQTGDMEWKDYGKGIVYKVKEFNGLCKITASYDNEVALAKVYKVN